MFGLSLSRLGLYAIGLALFVGMIWAYGQSQRQAGKLEGKAEVQGEIRKYEARVAVLIAQNAEDKAKLQAAQQEVTAKLQAELIAAQLERQRVKVIVKEVDRYVTVKADSECVVTAGAAWVLASAVGPEQPDPAAALAEGRPADVDGPSGITLSQVVGISADNLGECVERGQVIRAWQSWYAQNERLYEDYRKTFKDPPKIEKGP